jgi:hypothetical protein
MASVNAVYSTLKDLVNKDQKGFVTPAVFNNLAGIAQINIYNRLFDTLKDARRTRRAQFDSGRDKSLEKRIQEDLSSFARNQTITRAGGVFAKPDDLSRIISATTFGSIVLGQSTRTPIEMLYDEDKIERILRSNISSPTESFPIALVSDDIEVFPQTINRIQLRYYKIPSSPTFAYVTVNGIEIYNATGSVDFDLPDHYSAMLVTEIAELIGLNLRDQAVQAFSQQEQVMLTKQQSF